MIRIGSVLYQGLTFPLLWASQTSGTARSSTSGSPRRTRTGTRTATSRTRSSSARTASARTSAGSHRAARQGRVRGLDRPRAERGAPKTAPATPAARAVQAAPGDAAVRVHLVVPRSFNDAQQIADKFKEGTPVILNLQGSDPDLSKRLIDFASGLTYALDGGMQRVADKVFLLTPRNVEVSAEERARCSSAAASSQPGPGRGNAAPRAEDSGAAWAISSCLPTRSRGSRTSSTSSSRSTSS